MTNIEVAGKSPLVTPFEIVASVLKIKIKASLARSRTAIQNIMMHGVDSSKISSLETPVLTASRDEPNISELRGGLETFHPVSVAGPRLRNFGRHK